MPFSIKIDLGADDAVVLDSWLDDSFGKYVPLGTPFARGRMNGRPGYIVTNGPMFLSGHSVGPGSLLEPGDVIAWGAADGDDIPYGRPYCIFLEHDTLIEREVDG